MSDRKRLLDPVSRISEVLFGLIMALTFTGSLSVAKAGRDDVRAMLIGAIGCNIAWGLVDAVMYLVSNITARGRELGTVRAVRGERDPDKARQIIADAMPTSLAAALPERELDALRARIAALPEPPAHPRWQRDDFLGASAVFLLVALSTFPVVVPFIVMRETSAAMRVSNAVALVSLFICGHRLGQYAYGRPWRTGIAMALVGSVLVALTIALGG